MINDLRGFYEAAGGDYDSVLNRVMGKEQLLQKYLTLFLSDPAYSELAKAVQEQDYENILIKAHTLKAVALSLGLINLSKCSFDIVSSLRNNNIKAVDELFAKLQHEYERIITALNA